MDGLSRLWTGTRNAAEPLESQKVSERRIKELANIEKLEVAEISLQEARAQATEIVCAEWLDDPAKGTPEDLVAEKQ